MAMWGSVERMAMVVVLSAPLASVPWRSAALAETTFTEEAFARGINYVVTQGAFGGPGQYGCGLALCDLDGDGDEDVICTGGDDPTIALFENQGNGHFTDRSTSAGFGSPLKPSGIAAGDYDADGDLDIVLTRWLGPPILFRNEGRMHFTNVTAAAGIVSAGLAAGAGASWADFDGDGWIDLSIANRSGNGATAKNQLFRNLGNGTFVDVAPALGVNDGFASFQGSWCDIDRDGDLDLYVANDKGSTGISWNHLYRNQGNGTFAEDPASGAQISMDAMGVCFGDLTGDLFPEIFLPNVPSGNALLKSNGGIGFTDVAGAAGVGGFATCWGGIAFDPDNDGDTDLYFTTSSSGPDFLFENAGRWPLLNRTATWGLANLGEAYCHAAGDIDGDGDIDLLVQGRDATVRLFVNHAESIAKRHWAKFRPVGIGADRNAIGLQIDVDNGHAVQWRQVECGSAYKSQSSTVLHVGLGDVMVMSSVVARWPNGGGTRTLLHYGADRTWALVPPVALGDANGDGTLGYADHAALQARIGLEFAPGCEAFDLDGDADVDLDDEAAFLRRFCDLNRDGVVGPIDMAALLGRWGLAAATPAEGDFDGDGEVGAGDLALLVEGWGG